MLNNLKGNHYLFKYTITYNIRCCPIFGRLNSRGPSAQLHKFILTLSLQGVLAPKEI